MVFTAMAAALLECLSLVLPWSCGHRGLHIMIASWAQAQHILILNKPDFIHMIFACNGVFRFMAIKQYSYFKLFSKKKINK